MCGSRPRDQQEHLRQLAGIAVSVAVAAACSAKHYASLMGFDWTVACRFVACKLNTWVDDAQNRKQTYSLPSVVDSEA